MPKLRLLVACLTISLLFVFVSAQEGTGGTTTLELPEAVQQFITSVNAGDADAVAATFAEDAVFDSVGRIYDGRGEIMNRFLAPEVIDLGGQYEVLRISEGEDDRVIVEFDFTAGDLYEHFTYDFLIEDGLIQEVVGRYVSG